MIEFPFTQKRDRRSFVVIDLETAHLSDAGHRQYQAMERFDPKQPIALTGAAQGDAAKRDPRRYPRWPFRSIVAAAIIVGREHDDGNIEVSTFRTFSNFDHSEQEIVAEIFKLLEAEPKAQIVTYGGTAHDLQILTFAAMRFGLSLPPGWSWMANGGRNPRHLDLAWILSGGLALSLVHMTELCAATDIPAKVVAGPTAVGRHIHRGDWAVVESIVEMDTISTILLLARWLQLQDACADMAVVEDRILREVIEERPHRCYAPALRDRRAARFATQIAQANDEAQVYAPWLEHSAA